MSRKLLVTGKYEVKGVGNIVQGVVLAGAFGVGDEFKFVPSLVSAKVESLQRGFRASEQALPGDTVSMMLKLAGTAKAADVMVGDMAVAAEDGNIKSCRELRALVFVPQTGCVKRIRAGFRSHIFLGSDHQPCVVKEIEWKNSRSVDDAKAKEARFGGAEVVLTLDRAMAVAKFADCKRVGRFVTVTCNAPVMYGKVMRSMTK